MVTRSLDVRDRPDDAFIKEMSVRFPIERESDELLVRKLERRRDVTETYTPATLDELARAARDMFRSRVEGPVEVRDPRWLAGGASKLQILFDLVLGEGPLATVEQVVVRMDPEESHNATSRIREAEFLTALEGVVPVPHVYFVDEEGEWFPQPALVYAFADGVAKATSTNSGSVSGLGTGFPAHLREPLATQFVEQLGRIHGFDVDQASFTSMEKPELDSTQAALWQLNRARRVWEEDGSVQTPLMTVAVNWLERNMPTTDKVSIVHGDFRSGNFLFDEDSAQITALLDWERGHLGDRHRDLAWTTQAMFAHPTDDGSGLLVCGLMPEDEFYERYTTASGLTVDRTKMQWYAVLNAYQVLVTTLGSCYRVVRLEKNHQPALLSVLKAEAALCADRLRLLMMEVIG